MAFPKKKYWIEAGDIKTKLPKQHDTGMFRSLDEIVWDILKCCGWDCCTQSPGDVAELTFENGLTRTANTITLGGLLTAPTTIEGVAANTLTVNIHSGSNDTTVLQNASQITSTVTSATEATIVNQQSGKVTITHTGAGIATLGVGTASPTSAAHVVGLLEYADEAAAVLGGILTTGAFYKTATGELRIKL